MGLAGGVAAGKAAIGTYKVMKALTKGHKSAIQAHHIVEARHLKALKLSISVAPAIILSKLQHQQITNTLRGLLPYRSKYSKQQIMDAYKEFPGWIDEAGKYLGF